MWEKIYKYLIVNLFYLKILLYTTFILGSFGGSNFICVAEKILVINTERPNVTYFNTKYVTYANLTSQRYSRTSPFYYVNLHVQHLITIDRNIMLDFYFYEYLTNVYKRSFIEMHFELCHMLQHDLFFGAAMRQGIFAKPCPYPPGEIHLYNMTIDPKMIPPGFPFRKGRIYTNVSSSDTKELLIYGYIDMELKEVRYKKPKTN